MGNFTFKHYLNLFFLNIQQNTGPPVKAVKTPIGISWGRTARVIVSANNNRDAPAIIDKGITLRLSGPVINLTIWGIKRPTKPIIPETETQTAARIEPVTNKIIFVFFIVTHHTIVIKNVGKR